MRKIRLLAAAVFFAVFVAAFSGVFPAAKMLSYFVGDAAPVVSAGFASSFGIIAVGTLLALLLITFLCGRLYCAAVCPLGVLQDILGWLTQFRRGRTPKNHRGLRLTILAFVAIALIAGFALPLRVLGPYSLFGAIAAALFNPPLVALHNYFYPYAPSPELPLTAALLAPGIAVFVGILLLVLWQRRIFCTTLCPLGALLSLFAERAVFGLRIKKESCKSCGQCVKKCPAGCIELAAPTLDNGRCLRCGNCAAACKFRAVEWQKLRSGEAANSEANLPAPTGAPGGKKISRRELAVAAVVAAIGGAGYFLHRRYAWAIYERRQKFGQKFGNRAATPAPIIPPGAGSLPRFADKCTNCQLCLTHCPSGVLRPAGLTHETVHLQFDGGMCEFNCRKCGEVCPTGAIALLPLAEKQRRRIGLAQLTLDFCIAFTDETACGACAEVCSVHALEMVEGDGMPAALPQLKADLCIGCGGCEFVCPARPVKALVVKPVEVQVQAAVEEVKPQEAAGTEWLI
ncbi:ferredoxin [Planctomycetales bacterium]|nr:ferredoxin [Planctomycetales bacterium]